MASKVADTPPGDGKIKGRTLGLVAVVIFQ
jgi:hypothetical protein